MPERNIPLDWNQIDTVLLDMDGTLLDLHFDHYFWVTHLPKRYAEFHNIELSEAEQILTTWITSYQGTLQWYCLDHWSELIGMNISELKREVRHNIALRPHAEAFLRFLRQEKKKVILATNCHRSALELKLSVSQIDRWLDIVISSHDYQQPKEVQAFWQQMHEAEPFSLARTLFVDDNTQVLHSAKEFGIQHLVCINQPNSKFPAKKSKEFIDIVDFDEIMPQSSTLANES